jgi:HlyD family type I secretion membrane fusion protein
MAVQADKPDVLNIPDLRRTAIAGAAVIVFTFGAFAAWAALAPIAGAVIAAGTVKVDSNRKTVQHLEGGIVQEIRVRDGDRVEAGQVLVVLQDTTVDASVDLLSGQLLAESAKVARLTAERDGLDQVRFPPALTASAAGAKAAEILRAERHLFSVRLAALEEQVRSLQSQIEEARHEVANVTAQVESETQSVEYLQEEVAVNERLYQDKFINKSRLLGLRRELAETEPDLRPARAAAAVAGCGTTPAGRGPGRR